MDELEVDAVFFDDPDMDGLWVVEDRLEPQYIINDRVTGRDVTSGCWVRNWRLVDAARIQ